MNQVISTHCRTKMKVGGIPVSIDWALPLHFVMLMEEAMKSVSGIGNYLTLCVVSKRREIAFYLTIFILLSGGVVLLIYQPLIAEHIPNFPEVLGEEIGKAFIVASILAGSVDIYLKRRLAQDFVRDVSPFIEGFGLPLEFQDEIAAIKRIPLYRKNYYATYRISQDPLLPKGFVRVRTTTHYDIVNATDSPQKYEISFALEESHPHIETPKITSVGIRGDSIRGLSKEIEDSVSSNTKSQDGFLAYTKEVLIPPGNDQVTIWAEGESVVEEDDSDVLYLMCPTMKLTVKVEAPGDFEASVYFGHRFQELSPPKIACIPPAPNTHTWEIAAAMLRGHSISIQWSKKQTPPTATAVTGSATHANSQDNASSQGKQSIP